MFKRLFITAVGFLVIHSAIAQTAVQYYNDGIKLQEQEKFDEALVAFKNAIVKDPTYKDALYSAGYVNNELGKYTDALLFLKRVNDLNPNNVKFINELGYTYYSLQNADEALNAYKKALMVDSKSLTALNGVADVYRKLKKNQTEAIRLYAKTLEINPKNIKANYWTGWCYNELGKHNDAIPYLKKVIEVDDQYVSAYTELGYCDYALKNYDEALVNFKKAFAIEKTELNLYYTGLCFVGKKDKASALKMMNDLKGLDSKYAQDLQDSIDKM